MTLKLIYCQALTGGNFPKITTDTLKIKMKVQEESKKINLLILLNHPPKDFPVVLQSGKCNFLRSNQMRSDNHMTVT